MEHKITYTLHISEKAYMEAAKKLELKDWIDTLWVDFEHGNPEDDEDDRIIIRYPNPKHEDLTRELFFSIVCFAYPISHYPTGQLNIECAAYEGEAEAVRFQDVFYKGAPKSWYGNFRYEASVFAKASDNKLTEIKKIIYKD